jgi:Toprim domain-containing protein
MNVSRSSGTPGAREIAQELASRIELLVRVLLPNGKRRGGYLCTGSIADEPGQSLAVHLSGDRAGRWCDYATEEKGDALDLVAATLGLSIGEAMRWAVDWLGGSASVVQAHRHSVRTDRHDEVNLEIARRIWRETRPISGTPGEHYLRNVRRIGLDIWPATVRHHPRLFYGAKRDGITYPGIVCQVQSASGEFLGIWRIFIDPRTGNKAAVTAPRMGLGPVRSGAIRLAPVGEELTLGEGLETCLAVLYAAGHACWSGMSASLMRGVRLPALIRRITLLEENDPPDARGRRASPDAIRALSDRFLTEGRDAWIVRSPPDAKDMNDVLMQGARHG